MSLRWCHLITINDKLDVSIIFHLSGLFEIQYIINIRSIARRAAQSALNWTGSRIITMKIFLILIWQLDYLLGVFWREVEIRMIYRLIFKYRMIQSVFIYNRLRIILNLMKCFFECSDWVGDSLLIWIFVYFSFLSNLRCSILCQNIHTAFTRPTLHL